MCFFYLDVCARSEEHSLGKYSSFSSISKASGFIASPSSKNTTIDQWRSSLEAPPEYLINSLPDFFKQYYGMENLYDLGIAKHRFIGPNCFNTALKYNNNFIQHGFTSSKMMMEELKKEYKLLLPQQDSDQLILKKGDVITLWARKKKSSYRIKHAAIFINSKWFFGKESSLGNHDPYELTIPARQFIEYDPVLQILLFGKARNFRISRQEVQYRVYRRSNDF